VNKEQIIIDGYESGTPVAVIASNAQCGTATVKRVAKRLGLQHPGRSGANSENAIIGTDTSSLKGESIMSREPTHAELSAFQRHCEENNLPFENWKAFWHKTKEYSSLFANKAAEQESIDNQEIFLQRLQKAAPKTKKSPVPTKTLAIPANFDVHIGKHCELIRTGNDYTPDKAVKQVLEGQAALYQMTKPFGVSDILLPLGNDIVHVNNNRNETTNGTHQDSYGSVESQMYLAAELYIRSIEMFSQNHNVWLCHVPSNHDKETGWSVSQAVSRYFQGSKNPRVHVREELMSQQYRKYFVFGENLIMLHHGDMRKEEKLLGLITAEAREAVSKTNRIYVYQGDTHHKTLSRRGVNSEVDLEKDHSALTIMRSGGEARNKLFVETVRSPSPADDWHSKSAFLNLPAIEMFLHNEQAQFGRFTHWF